MNRILGPLPFLLLIFLAGCLEFDAQEITMRYDAKADRIDFLVVYRGVFVESGSGGTDDPMKNAFDDLQKVLDKGESYFWCNWPFKIDPIDPPAATAALAAHLEVENGVLYTDPTGVLNGYQFVRIARATEFLQKLNTMLELAVQAALLGGFRGVAFDDDTKELVTEFLRSGEKMVAIEAGRVELRLPCSQRDFQQLLGKVESYFLSNVPSDIVRRFAVEKRRAAGDKTYSTGVGEDEVKLDVEQLRLSLQTAAGMRFFWDNEITVERTEELQTLGLGAKGNKELTLRKASDGFYSDNFLRALRERGDKLEEGVPDQEIRRRFDAFLKREPNMPEALRAVRRKQ